MHSHITPVRIQKHIDSLSQIGNLGPKFEDGFTRASWSKEETLAMEYISNVAKQSGFTSHYDEIGNIYLSYGCDESKEVIQIGSHLDTVVKGGLYDGATGIIAGLEAFIEVSQSSTPLKRGLQLVVWRGEESGTFGVVFKGSKAAFGLLPASALESKFGGLTLEEAITAEGFNPEIIRSGKKTLDQNNIDKMSAHLELHIEQASKLELEGDDIGIATSIRGTHNYRISIKGQASHSGATPMGVTYRKDANLAMAYMQVALDKQGIKELEQGKDLVQTVGVINSNKTYNQSHLEVYDTGPTTICAYSYFYFNLRSNDEEFLNTYSEKCLSIISNVANDFKVNVEIEKISSSDPLKEMDAYLQDIAEEETKKIGYKVQRLASGAGHDVQIVAQQKKTNGDSIPALLIFIPCRDGLSHNPLEFATTEAITKGAKVLANVVRRLAI